MLATVNLLPNSSCVVRNTVGSQIVCTMPTVATRTATVTTSLVASDVPSRRRMMKRSRISPNPGARIPRVTRMAMGAGQSQWKRICQ